MKQLALWLPLTLAASAIACGHAATEQPAAAPAEKPALTLVAAAVLPATPPAPTPRYDVRGIFDPGLGGIVAYALKVPHGWLLQQSFTRAWDRNMPIDQLFFNVTSPDQHTAITVLPQTTYSYDKSPAAAQITAFLAQGGHRDKSKLDPLLPVAYLKQVLLPRLGRQPATRLRLTAEHEDAPVAKGQNTQYASGWVEGVLPSGRKVRVTSEIMLSALNLSGYPSGSWLVLTSIAESDTDLAAAVAQSQQLAKSVVVNPAWQRQDAELQQRGTQANIDESQQQIQQGIAANRARLDANYQRFRQNVASQQATSNAINQNYAQKQRANGQVTSAYADYMGDKTLYQNPDTGERFQVQGSLGNVYQDAQAGVVLNSSQPLSGNHVNWQQLQQVELKNY